MVQPGTLATSGAQNGQEAVNTTASVAEAVAGALLAALDFAEEEASNRAFTGTYTDYEREPNDLADRIRGALSAYREQGIELREASAALAVVRQSLAEQAMARSDETMPILSDAVRDRLRSEAEAAYALSEDKADRIYAHGLSLLAQWQDRAALARAEARS